MDFYRLSEFKGRNFSKAVNELYNLTDFNTAQYPEYLKWFFSTNIPRILDNKGDIIFSLDGFMLKGLAILKNTQAEKKICTLMVDEPYRGNKLGSILLEQSFKYLGTDKPVITIPSNKLKQFQQYVNAYNWKDTEILSSYFSEEIKFN